MGILFSLEKVEKFCITPGRISQALRALKKQNDSPLLRTGKDELAACTTLPAAFAAFGLTVQLDAQGSALVRQMVVVSWTNYTTDRAKLWPTAYYMLGCGLYHLGLYADALAAFEVAKKKGASWFMTMRADCLLALGRKPVAMNAYLAAIRSSVHLCNLAQKDPLLAKLMPKGSSVSEPPAANGQAIG